MGKVPRWNKINEGNFLNELGKQLEFNKMNDWYNITACDIINGGGSGLLNKYGNSPSKLIMSIYSNHEWKQSNFNKQIGYWNNKENQREFLVGKQLGFNQMNDLYNITVKAIMENGGSGLLNKCDGSPSKLITPIYSNHEWKQSNFNKNQQIYWDNKENQR